MPLYAHEINADFKGCDPEARFLLEAMVRQVLRGGELSFSAKEIALGFRLAYVPARRALSQLEAAGVVSLDSKMSGRRGRPVVSFSVKPSVIASVQELRAPGEIHAAAIDRLLSREEITLATRQSQQGVDMGSASRVTRRILSACDRLLLASLLAHADRLGVVRVGKSDLTRLTGISETRLRYRLQSLMDVKLIAACVPGVSSSIFPSGKACSTYFVDPSAIGGGGMGGEFLVRSQIGDPGPKRTSREQILELVSSRKKAALFGIEEFLAGQHDAVFEVLRLSSIRHASHILSLHGVDPGQWSTAEDAVLRKKIAADLRRPQHWNGREVLDQEWGEIIEHFYKLAFVVAREFAQRSDLAHWESVAYEEICILPLTGSTQRFFVLCRVASGAAGMATGEVLGSGSGAG